MLKVFLVDDEIIIRESIRSCGIWDHGDFTLVGEASDGEIALSMLQDIKPDILITDIKMPFMDGLELSRQVHQTMPWIHIIILSGYDDFTFAKTAINLGVTDYLLKPVDADELLPALQKTAESIRMEREQEQNIHELRQQEIKNRPLLEEQLLKILLEADAGQQEQTNALVQLRKLHIDMTAHFYMVCLLSPRYTQQRLHEHTQVMAALHRLCLNSGGTIHATETSGLCIVLVMGDSEADVEERGYAFAQTALFEVKRTAGIDASISLGQAVDTLKDIPVSLQTAQEIDLRIGEMNKEEQEKRHIIGVKDVEKNATIPLTDFPTSASLDEQLRFVALENVEQMLDCYIDSLGVNALHSKVLSSYLYMQVLLSASAIIREKGGNPKAVLPTCVQNESAIIASQSMEELRELLLKIITSTVSFREEKTASCYSLTCRRAVQYIHAHLSDVALNMRDTAAYVALSNSHFSTVFSQEMGMTFTEYVTNMRMNKAKELLRNTDMLSQDIASQVGYNDRHYFSYLFKKTTGQSPSDYRKQNLSS